MGLSYLQFSVTEQGETRAEEARVLELEAGLSLPEIARLARAFARTGLTRVRLAGGEPLAWKRWWRSSRRSPRQAGIGVVAMTTDGVHLARFAEPLLFAGLQRLTITLDSLDRETYRRITGHDALPQVLAGLEAVRPLPFQQVCVEMTVRRGRNDEEIPAFVKLARETGFTVRFSELPRGGDEEEWEAEFVSAAEIRAAARIRLRARNETRNLPRNAARRRAPGSRGAGVGTGEARMVAPPRKRLRPPDLGPQAHA